MGKIIEEPRSRVGSIYTYNTVYIYIYILSAFCFILDRTVALALTPVKLKDDHDNTIFYV